jgi:hypothetical protein
MGIGLAILEGITLAVVVFGALAVFRFAVDLSGRMTQHRRGSGFGSPCCCSAYA